jgi:HPt (histidine-containing phosphotransfer) domain-containing protein
MTRVQKVSVASPLPVANMPALDVEFLNVATFHDIALRAEIISLFRQQIKTLGDQLALPVDGESWAYLTHTLKGSASAVGASQLATLAERWELEEVPGSGVLRLMLVTELAKCFSSFNAVADQL